MSMIKCSLMLLCFAVSGSAATDNWDIIHRDLLLTRAEVLYSLVAALTQTPAQCSPGLCLPNWVFTYTPPWLPFDRVSLVCKALGLSLLIPPSPLAQISHHVLSTVPLLKHSSLLSVGLYECRRLYLKCLSSYPTLHLHCCILTFSLGFPMPKLSVMQRIPVRISFWTNWNSERSMVSLGAAKYTFQIHQKCLSTEARGGTWLPARFQNHHLNLCHPATHSDASLKTHSHKGMVNSRSLKVNSRR